MMNSYQPGELVFVQGQPSECVYLIESGEIELLESTDSRTVRIAKLVKDDGACKTLEKQATNASYTLTLKRVDML